MFLILDNHRQIHFEENIVVTRELWWSYGSTSTLLRFLIFLRHNLRREMFSFFNKHNMRYVSGCRDIRWWYYLLLLRKLDAKVIVGLLI